MLFSRVMATSIPFFTWKPEFALGMPGIDAEHERFFEIVNELHEAIRDGDGDLQLGATHRRLMDYAIFHFSSEEAALRKVAYPRLDAHHREHEWFLGEVGKIRSQRRDAAIAALSLARDWLLQHILGTDKRCADWLRAPRRTVPEPHGRG